MVRVLLVHQYGNRATALRTHIEAGGGRVLDHHTCPGSATRALDTLDPDLVLCDTIGSCPDLRQSLKETAESLGAIVIMSGPEDDTDTDIALPVEAATPERVSRDDRPADPLGSPEAIFLLQSAMCLAKRL